MRRKSARKIAGASKPAVARAARAKRVASTPQSDRGTVSEADAAAAAKIMDDIRSLGRKPLRVRGDDPDKRHEKPRSQVHSS